MMRWVIAACLSCTVSALRKPAVYNGPAADPNDPTLCQHMLGEGKPAGMNLLQTDAEQVLWDPRQDNLYEKLDKDPTREEVETGSEHFAELPRTSDAAAFSHLQNRNIIFMGDSTIEELMWDTIYSLNDTVPDEGGWNDVPAKQCTYKKCGDVCDGRDKPVPHQHLHMMGRCSVTSSPECLETIPQIQKLNTTFSFLWTATPFICCNGVPGIYGTIRNPQWMDVFHEYAARAPYDDLIFSSGTHDYFAGGNETQYRMALEEFLDMLEPLGKRLVFISPQTPTPREVNIEVLARRPRWKFIDRMEYSHDLHCSQAKWTFSYFHYRRSTQCHKLVEGIFS